MVWRPTAILETTQQGVRPDGHAYLNTSDLARRRLHPEGVTVSLPAVTDDVHNTETVCQDCGTFIKWLSTRSPEERAERQQAGISQWMSTQPPTARQLRALRRMGYRGKPSNRLDARDKIDALRKARGWL